MGEFRPAGFDDLATQHHVCEIGCVLIQQLVMVGNDENPHRAATIILFADLGNALAGQLDRVDVQTAVGFIEDRELGSQHGHLQNLGPLHFAAGKTVVHIAAGEFDIHPQVFHLFSQFLAELTHGDEIFAFLARWVANIGRGMAEEIGHLHAGDRHRPLKRHENSRAGSFRGIPFGNVLAVEFDCPLGDFIVGVSHDDVAECALAGTVGSHESMGFATVDREIHAPQNWLAFDRDMEIRNFQRFSHFKYGVRMGGLWEIVDWES